MPLWLFVVTITFISISNAQTNIKFNQGKASYFDAGQLHLISSSVTGQSKEDVLYSLLLAQLGADAKAQRSSIVNWYENYQHIFSNIAWITTSFDTFSPFNPSTDRISLKSVITTSLAGRINPELENILNNAFDKIQQLSPGDPAIEEFTRNVGDGNVYNMQVQLVDENSGGLTVLQLYITLSTSESAGSDVFLLHEYARNAATIQVAYETITLNSGIYEKIRRSIIDKLGPERIARNIHVLFDDGSTF